MTVDGGWGLGKNEAEGGAGGGDGARAEDKAGMDMRLGMELGL